ncbi:DNA ligase 1 isoform X4 [Gossypium hirsutum]|uniref:DNA ligase 1 isoform X4 n=1 Tax=Gossypium hirsutum TaxID=3635 RepID=A0ABM3AIR6_GOSHI|nr:DNA ligase 1 isoform X4 [Gossypium hirsutum]
MQILSTRARKNVLLSDIKVDVCIFAFDILYLNGQALLQEQLEIRKEIGDTLDLLPVAAFHGKRTGVCGSFLLACYDDNNEEYQGICKIGIGFTEAVCEECSASLRSKVIPEPKHSYYHYTGEMPDVWFEAAELAMTLVRRLSSFFHNKVGWDVCAPTLHHDREKHRSFTDLGGKRCMLDH